MKRRVTGYCPESAINDAIRHMNVTRIIIAHRPETILSADRIIEIHSRGVIEVAKHDFIHAIKTHSQSCRFDL